MIRRLLFIDDESVYRLTSGGKATPAETRQYQLVVSMNFLLPQTLEDLLALALIEKRISKLHALEVLLSLLLWLYIMLSVFFRCFWGDSKFISMLDALHHFFASL